MTIALMTLWALVAPLAAAVEGRAPTCTGSAATRKGGGEAGGVCRAPAVSRVRASVPTPCDPDSVRVASYGDPPPSHEYLYHVAILAQGAPPPGMRWAGAYNCAGVYLGGPHLVAGAEQVDVTAVRDAARARVNPPLPVPRVSPPEAVVAEPTWLWLDAASWRTASATATQGTVTVRVDAAPVRATWDLVEGTRVCAGPGTAWSPAAAAAVDAGRSGDQPGQEQACTFTFAHSSTVEADGVYDASVTVVWEFSWWLNGAAQGVFGTVDTTTGFDLRVGEVQALITRY